MSHDIEASYAAAEIVRLLLASPQNWFDTPPAAATLSAYAAREGRHAWPHADGVIAVSIPGPAAADYTIAVEYKRPNEGLHGVLTAIGQSHAYLRKGYAGAVLVVPDSYPGFAGPGAYAKDVIDLTSQSRAIGVFSYSKPNMAAVSPFAGKLQMHRTLAVDAAAPIAAPLPLTRTQTQWAHVREGSTDPDAFFRYLQAVKLLGGGVVQPTAPVFHADLLAAVQRLRPGIDPARYLSNCMHNELPDQAWRHFWFTYVLHPAALAGWQIGGPPYQVNGAQSLLTKSNGKGPKNFFVGKSNSIKNRIVSDLNAGAITLDEAHDRLAKNYFDRAHSYREDIDSGCEHLGFVDANGRLTDVGYRFVDACERYGDPNSGVPKAIFLRALVGEGALGAFLHYIYRLSEERFNANPLAFTIAGPAGAPPVFQQAEYLNWLEDEMEARLHVLRKVTARGGVARKPFQAELAVLRGLGLVGRGFRIGVGLPINWPELQESMSFASEATFH
ncbi:hypothetical protein LB524_00100 [Mesorhizobium sp. ESP6-5]|uniref:hypothetical protein n=1 Tax=Mesorhizobium sp. ESP6-5 TaxID=2876623 RepID=UPI001CCF13D0|nr:hypothetical protein [Mesorhizobium sp. ESP6-5]MBZ9753675.1 hypothetical protein [Mesorhizobium sp. ESP6-5]